MKACKLTRIIINTKKSRAQDREPKQLVPEEAFREALANALIHRTWDVQSQIRIFMYNTKIEFLSPGGLPVLGTSGLTPDEEAVLTTLSRNIASSISEIEPKVQFSRSKATYILKQLVDKNYVVKEGNGRGTKYWKH